VRRRIANPEIYEFLEAADMGYVILLPLRLMTGSVG
jgi:hypothetical protein